ncbi:MAG: hypothetical protein HC842_06970 [Cytophagales bacterium]|nr:hypothetical protein [Cytophagales bacterium]
MLALGALLSDQHIHKNSSKLCDYEFRIFSQFGDDGIIQYLTKTIKFKNHTFIEFGVEDFQESNCRFLLMYSNWSGYVLDGNPHHMESLARRPWYWKYDLRQKAAFITKENINELLKESGFKDLGILSIDIDGNDFHILSALDFSELNPCLLIMEYNGNFGPERAVTVPYQPDFTRASAHYSHLYFGASLKALSWAASQKGYTLIGSNSAGNNAYFLRKDLLTDDIRAQEVEAVFRKSKFRESRNQQGQLNYLRGDDAQSVLKGLPVLNVETQQLERL